MLTEPRQTNVNHVCDVVFVSIFKLQQYIYTFICRLNVYLNDIIILLSCKVLSIKYGAQMISRLFN